MDNIEHFVSLEKASQALSISRRFLQSLARKGIHGAYPIGTGTQRRRWIFKLSELMTGIASGRYDPNQGSPR
jgi:hypothetical protein